MSDTEREALDNHLRALANHGVISDTESQMLRGRLVRTIAQVRVDEREKMRDWLERHAEELVQEASDRIARSGGAS